MYPASWLRYCFQPISLAYYDDVYRPQNCDIVNLPAKFRLFPLSPATAILFVVLEEAITSDFADYLALYKANLILPCLKRVTGGIHGSECKKERKMFAARVFIHAKRRHRYLRH